MIKTMARIVILSQQIVIVNEWNMIYLYNGEFIYVIIFSFKQKKKIIRFYLIIFMKCHFFLILCFCLYLQLYRIYVMNYCFNFYINKKIV